MDTPAIATACHEMIRSWFGSDITVRVITAVKLSKAVANAPDWQYADKDWKHNAILVIPPMTAKEFSYQKNSFLFPFIFVRASI